MKIGEVMTLRRWQEKPLVVYVPAPDVSVHLTRKPRTRLFVADRRISCERDIKLKVTPLTHRPRMSTAKYTSTWELLRQFPLRKIRRIRLDHSSVEVKISRRAKWEDVQPQIIAILEG